MVNIFAQMDKKCPQVMWMDWKSKRHRQIHQRWASQDTWM